MYNPYTAQDIVRRVVDEASSARPDAPVRPERPRMRAALRVERLRVGLGASLRRLADRIEPARPLTSLQDPTC